MSIEHDGSIQPLVTGYDPERARYVIVDSFRSWPTLRMPRRQAVAYIRLAVLLTPIARSTQG